MNLEEKSILCFGNSLTAGYGFTQEFSYPGLLQSKIRDLKLNYNVINAGISGETSAGGLNRIDDYLQINFDIFILELGINDGLRGMSVETMESNLRAILVKVRNKDLNIKLVVAGMQLPIAIKNNYINMFISTYPRLAEEFQATLIPFFLQDVMGVKDLNLPDGLHPNKEGYEIIAENVYQSIYPLLV